MFENPHKNFSKENRKYKSFFYIFELCINFDNNKRSKFQKIKPKLFS